MAVYQFAPDGVTHSQNVAFDATQSTFITSLSMLGFEFEPGVDFNISLGFGVAARVFNGPAAVQNSFVEADFLSTMKVTGLEVFDSDNISVTGWQIASASGALYRADGISPVPEPSTLTLLALGLAGLGYSRRKRSHQSTPGRR
jgi:hypothetical protein